MRAVQAGRAMAMGMGLAVMGALAGCDTIGNPLEALSKKKLGPDEFAVVVRDPLQMPPGLETSTLPPPSPGMRSPLEPNPQVDAIAALTGQPVSASAPQSVAISRGEAALLAAADANALSPTIRSDITAENVELEANKPYEPPSIFELFSGPSIDPETLIDPVAESQRLQSTGVPAPVNQRALQLEALEQADSDERAAEAAAAASAPPSRDPRFRQNQARDGQFEDTGQGIKVYQGKVF